MAKKDKNVSEQMPQEQIAEQVTIDRPGVINTQPEVTLEETQKNLETAKMDAAKKGLSGVPLERLSDGALKATITNDAPLYTMDELAVRKKPVEKVVQTGNEEKAVQVEKKVEPEQKAVAEEVDVNSLDARTAAARAGVQQKRDAATQARLDAEAKAREALQSAQKKESDAVHAYNDAMWNNLGEITSKIETMQKEAEANDETARRRENAMRYISGLGDTLSSVANLIGVAKGASNQNQTYNSHAVVQKAEEARKARKLEIDDLSKRLDEMMARQRELKAAGSLKEAEIAARQAKELAAQEAAARKAAIEEDRYYDALEKSAVTGATSAYYKEQEFTNNVRKLNENKKKKKPKKPGNNKPKGDDKQKGGKDPKQDTNL